jgi:chromosome segregation ATPase
LGNESIFIGSYNLPYSDFTRRENELWDAAGSSGLLHVEGGPSHVEEVLATNEGQTIEEQMAQLTAILQQKEDELAVLQQQTAVLQQEEHELVTLCHQAAMSQQRENELAALHQQVNAAMSQNSYQSASATISLEAIQRMIAEGVKAQYMQTHYSMWPEYVKPYPPKVDMVPFPCNYW